MSLAQGEEDSVGEREITTLLNLQCVFNCPINGNNEQLIPLSCMHFMCTNNCHRQLYTTGDLTCPLCHIVVKTLAKIVPDQVFPKEPDSGTIASIQLECDVCGSENAEPVVRYCPECKECLCNDCYHHHSTKAKKTRAHVVTENLTDLKMKEYQKLKEAERKCKQHDIELSEYCEKCEKLFCKSCLASHIEEGHSYFNIQKQLTENMNLARNFMGKYDEATKKLKIKETAVGKQIQKFDKNLTAHFDEFANKLQRELLQIGLRREEAGKDFFSRESSKLEFTKNQGAKLKDSVARFMTLMKGVRFEGSDSSSIKLMSQFVNEIKASEEIYTKGFEECTKNDIQIPINTFEEEDATIAKLIEGFAQINYNAMAVKARQDNELVAFEPDPCLDIEVDVESIEDDINDPINTNEAQERDPRIMNVLTMQDSSEGTSETSDKRHRPTRSARSTSSKRNKRENKPSKPKQKRKRHSNENDAPVPSKQGRQATPVVVSNTTLPASHVKFLSATQSSIEQMPLRGQFPIQIEFPLKKSDSPEHQNDDEKGGDNNDDVYCSICLVERDEEGVLLLCDFKYNNGDCGNAFHIKCHIPAYEQVPPEVMWYCCHHTTKSEIQKCLISASLGEREGSEKGVLNKSNNWHFQLACMFLTECYKFPEMPTMRWKFPEGYLEKYGKVPFHLKYIRERLTLQKPIPFVGVRSFLSAFRQMFDQALFYYQDCEQETQNAVKEFIKKFKILVGEFYPQHRDLLKNMSREK